MSQKSQMSRIIRKMYAKELDLIADSPVINVQTKKPWKTMKDFLWPRESKAIRVAVVALILATISAAVYYFNFFTINIYDVRMLRADIEAQLQRRNDLIPNLVAAVNNYALYEKNIFIHAADVRSAVESIEKTIQAAGQEVPPVDMSVLSKFQAVAEAYPALKASEAYQTLMVELSNTETLIADMRVSYNRSANFYNSRLDMFPGNIFALLFGFESEEIFESEHAAKSAPKVEQRER